jgi:cyclopropane fatty-acyl-phospholipid synthase-like methyltransferase
MQKNYIEIYKDGTYLKNNPTWDAEDSTFKANKILKLLSNHKIPLNSICEVGCGSGEILVQLSNNLSSNTKFFGFDISAHAINIAKKKETEQIKFELKDFTDVTLNQQFDLILIMDVIEHVEDYFKFLRALSTKSRYKIFHIPIDMCAWSLFREKMLIESKEKVGHIHVFTEDFIKSVLNDCGYKIIEQIYTEPIYNATSTKQKIIELIRRLLFKINKRFCSKTIGGISIMILTENEKKL